MAYEPPQALSSPVQSITSDTTLDGTKGIIMASAAAGNVTITLHPAAQLSGGVILIRRTDTSANLLTVAAGAGDTVDGVASVLITTMVPGKLFAATSATAWQTVIGT